MKLGFDYKLQRISYNYLLYNVWNVPVIHGVLPAMYETSPINYEALINTHIQSVQCSLMCFFEVSDWSELRTNDIRRNRCKLLLSYL